MHVPQPTTILQLVVREPFKHIAVVCLGFLSNSPILGGILEPDDQPTKCSFQVAKNRLWIGALTPRVELRVQDIVTALLCCCIVRSKSFAGEGASLLVGPRG